MGRSCVCLFGPFSRLICARVCASSPYALALLHSSSLAMSKNILDPAAVISKLPQLLPQGKKLLQTQQDALVALVHSAMTALGFRLIGIDDSPSLGSFENNVLPDGWNAHGPGSYTHRYKHEQSSLEFVLKLGKLGSRFTINAIALEVRMLNHLAEVISLMLDSLCRVTRSHRLMSRPTISLLLRSSPMTPALRELSRSSMASSHRTASQISWPSSS